MVAGGIAGVQGFWADGGGAREIVPKHRDSGLVRLFEIPIQFVQQSQTNCWITTCGSSSEPNFNVEFCHRAVGELFDQFVHADVTVRSECLQTLMTFFSSLKSRRV